MGKDELAFLVLCGLNVNLNLVTDLEVWIVTELRSLDDTLALVTYVDDNLSLGDGGNGSFNDLVLHDLGESLVISVLDGLLVLAAVNLGAAFKRVPVELVRSHGCVERCFLCRGLGLRRFLYRSLYLNFLGYFLCFFCHNGN